MSSPPTFREIWDIVVFLMLLPPVALMSLQIPGDWQHHTGESLPGTATVTRLAPTARGGESVVVEVRSESGTLIATDQEINGDPVHELGASFDVSYLAPDRHGNTQVYTRGHDPFSVNALVLLILGLTWLTSVPFVVARLFRIGRRLTPRQTPRPGSQYSAGRGYVSE